MRKLFFVSIILCFCFIRQGIAQSDATREETINWILSKKNDIILETGYARNTQHDKEINTLFLLKERINKEYRHTKVTKFLDTGYGVLPQVTKIDYKELDALWKDLKNVIVNDDEGSINLYFNNIKVCRYTHINKPYGGAEPSKCSGFQLYDGSYFASLLIKPDAIRNRNMLERFEQSFDHLIELNEKETFKKPANEKF